MKAWQPWDNKKAETPFDAFIEDDADNEIELHAYFQECKEAIKAGYLEAEGYDDDDYRVARMK
jgi:hypothetical protein